MQVCLPGPSASVHASFIALSSPITQLVDQLLLEDGPQIARTVCGKGSASQATTDKTQWRIQRVRKPGPNREWSDQELQQLNDQGARTFRLCR